MKMNFMFTYAYSRRTSHHCQSAEVRMLFEPVHSSKSPKSSFRLVDNAG
jgi:hypothetical protein